jgi:hypothetical protein
MIEPVEAEFARPPIFNTAQERVLREEDVELGRAISNLAPPTNSVTSSNAPSQTATLHEEPKTAGELERGEKKIIVYFEEGAGENPREWSKGKKWYVTASYFVDAAFLYALG